MPSEQEVIWRLQMDAHLPMLTVQPDNINLTTSKAGTLKL